MSDMLAVVARSRAEEEPKEDAEVTAAWLRREFPGVDFPACPSRPFQWGEIDAYLMGVCGATEEREGWRDRWLGMRQALFAKYGSAEGVVEAWKGEHRAAR